MTTGLTLLPPVPASTLTRIRLDYSQEPGVGKRSVMGEGASIHLPPSYQASFSSPLVNPHSYSFNSSDQLPQSATPLSHLPPPTQPTAFQHEWSHLNLPFGMFLLQNRAQGKTLDLLGHKTHKGALFGAHPVKQPTLKGLSLQHNKNNQLFFLDWNGHLYSAAASKPLDVIDDQLVLSQPGPIQTYASPLSHPLPRFHLDPSTQTLQVIFSHDPTYPPPLSTSTSSPNEEFDYLIETVPLKRQKPKSSNPLALSDFNSIPVVGKVVKNGLGGLLSRVGGASYPEVDSNEKGKRLPRTRDASLPPPPIPSKDPPPLPPVPPSTTSSSSQKHRLSIVSMISPTQSSILKGYSIMSPEQTPDPQSRPPTEEEEEEEQEEEESESDDEPLAYRPVRIVKLKRNDESGNWRDKFPFTRRGGSEPSPSSSVSKGGGGVEVSPIGLGFEERSVQSQEEDVESKDLILSSNIWGNHLSLSLDAPSLASTSTSTTTSTPPSLTKEQERERREKRKWELKEMRKWRRRQFDVVPVTIRPEPIRESGGSLRVRHELEEGMYTFRGEMEEGDRDEELEGSEEGEEEEEGWELDHGDPRDQQFRRSSSSLAAAPEEESIKMSEEKRGSVVSTTARSMVSGVGTFFSNALLWSTSAPSPNPTSQDDELPPLPFDDETEEEEVLDERDAEEVGMEEVLRRFGEDEAKRKESFQSAVVLVPYQQKEVETLSKDEVGSPPLPDLPQVPASNDIHKVQPQEVPLPPSMGNTPRIDEGEEEERERVLA